MAFNDIFLNKWAPALIAGLISFSIAWIMKSVERSRYFKDKRIDKANHVISNFSCYIENWRKLRFIAQLMTERELTEEEEERLNRYVSSRDDAKHELISSLNTLSLFFSDKVIIEARAFQAWDSAQSIKRLDELPTISEWENWLYRLSEILKKTSNCESKAKYHNFDLVNSYNWYR